MKTRLLPAPRHDDWWTERFEELNTRYRNWKGDLVFLGDSITEMWEWPGSGKNIWDKYWAPRNAANFGISGDCVEHVLWRLDHGNLDDLNPQVFGYVVERLLEAGSLLLHYVAKRRRTVFRRTSIGGPVAITSEAFYPVLLRRGSPILLPLHCCNERRRCLIFQGHSESFGSSRLFRRSCVARRS